MCRKDRLLYVKNGTKNIVTIKSNMKKIIFWEIFLGESKQTQNLIWKTIFFKVVNKLSQLIYILYFHQINIHRIREKH